MQELIRWSVRKGHLPQEHRLRSMAAVAKVCCNVCVLILMHFKIKKKSICQMMYMFPKAILILERLEWNHRYAKMLQLHPTLQYGVGHRKVHQG